MFRVCFAVSFLFFCAVACAGENGPARHIDRSSPWYPRKDDLRLTTPQWVGSEGVEAVVVLAIDDMRDTAKYEQYLRPILDRLKQIDGRAPVSIMTCDVKPDDPQLQSWLDEGLSIEVHTVDHPCPILQDGDHVKAKSTYDRCIDLLHRIPRNTPVAFRTPCCDSLNTVSPRFYSTIFDQETPEKHSLQLDSSVFNFFTSADESIPRDLVLDKDGGERFLKYMPRDNTYKKLANDHFVNYIQNYPYPYLINNNCWQFPCVAPSDWSAQHFHGENNPVTVTDWKAALDITVHKQGVFNLVFHPHGWITADQVVELIDHAVEKHGKKVQFLTFREAADRLNANVAKPEIDVQVQTPVPLPEGAVVLDFDSDGQVEILVRDGSENEGLWEWSGDEILKTSAVIPTAMSGNSADVVHFVDINGDDLLDAVCLTGNRWDVRLLTSVKNGWTTPAVCPKRLEATASVSEEGLRFILPWEANAVDAAESGFFAHNGWIGWQNEFTWQRPDLSYLVSFDELSTVPAAVAADAVESDPLTMTPVGAAVVDITPNYPTRLSGYGSRKLETEEVAARIHARALVIGGAFDAWSTDLEQVQQPFSVMLTVDSCGVPLEVTEAIFTKVKAKHAVKRSRFAVSSTHTHSAPWLRGFAPNVLVDVPPDHVAHLKQYEAELIDSLVSVVDKAIAARRPATLSIGHGKVGFAVNRRLMQDGRWTGFGDVPDGPVDRRFSLLAAHDADGDLVAVLGNYACHATTETGGLNSISGDWPGLAADNIEKDNVRAVALIAIGCGADANPSPRGTHELAIQHADRLAKEVQRLLTEPGLTKPISAAMSCKIARVDLPLGPLPSRAEWEKRATESAHAGVHGRMFLEKLDAGEAIATTVPDYPVQTWCFGDDLAMVFLGGEVVVDYAIRLSEMFDSDRLWINAYSNDVPCYIASKRILQEGGYEADRSMIYYARPTRLSPQAEDVICDTVQKITPHEFYSEDLQEEFPGPKDPDESLKCISTKPNLKVQLVAAEPLIHDPVAFDWDIEGRLWVVEMGDYPGTAQSTGGRVQVLTDLNGDGTYDKAVTFLDGLNFPSGIQRWRNGVIITTAPDIIYAEDTNGDFKADVRTVLYSGFAEGNQQHRVNGLRYGLDNWLHIANGDSGGQITVVESLTGASSGRFGWPGVITTGQSSSISGRDARIRPDEGILDPTFGRTQFCRERDDWGNWFGNNNSNPLWQYLGEERWFRGDVKAPNRTKIDVPLIPGAAPVFPTSRTLARFNDFDRANRFTSACSSMIYRDDYLGTDFYGNAYTCEPVHNLVSRLVLTSDRQTFVGTRAADEEHSEFFASSDAWTRPTMIRTGPDGALWVADMYRQVIEHPQWIPAEAQRKLNLRAGDDRGRIYRIVPAGECCQDGAANSDDHAIEVAAGSVSQPVPDLRTWFPSSWENTPSADLIQRLSSPNGWWRDAAQRVLVHRGANQETVDQLVDLLQNHESPLARLHALCTASEIDPANVNVIRIAVQDAHPGVQRHGVRLSERFVAAGDSDLTDDVFKLANSTDFHVLLQLAHLFSSLPDKKTDRMLPDFLVHVQNEKDIVGVALNAVGPSEVIDTYNGLLDLDDSDDIRPISHSLWNSFAELMGQRLDASDLQTLLIAKISPDMVHTLSSRDLNFTSTLLQRVRRRPSIWKELANSGPLLASWSGLRAFMSERLQRTESGPDDVATDLQLISLLPHLADADVRAIGQFISPVQPPEVQSAAVQALVLSSHETAASSLLSLWKKQTPPTRTAIIDGLMNRPSWTMLLLNAVKEKVILPMDLSAAVRERLLQSRDDEIRAAANALLNSSAPSPRGEIIKRLMPAVLQASGVVAAGGLVFEKRCAVCHRLQNIGKSIGADLAAVRDRSTTAMLTAILDPNKAVEAKFLAYTALTSDGLTHSGMLLNETSSGVVLIGTDGKEKTVARSELDEFICTQRSLMPEGLEKDLSIQDLANVIAFVQSAGVKWKSFDGNSPGTVKPNDDGTITLPADKAEIYGPNLVYERKNQNLGWWTSIEDQAIWTINVPESGDWTVTVDYASENKTAGNTLKLTSAGRLLTGRIPGTGTWDDYRTWTIGKLDLRKGQQRLFVTTPETPHGAVIDLRAIRLLPPE